ncbi:hypothetical protein DXG01_006983 [Tephrocybe rancida]|nr:hypothetical protein DXG01_006983 [Tephrocybe rancida]
MDMQVLVAKINSQLSNAHTYRANSPNALEALHPHTLALIHERLKMQQTMENLAGLISPIRVLPAEVLELIFRFAVDDFRRPFPPTSALELSHVSSFWRKIALGFPSLWNYGSPPDNTQMSLTHTESDFLSFKFHSRGFLLPYFGYTTLMVWRRIAPFHHRISHLDLQLHCNPIDLLRLPSLSGNNTLPFKSISIHARHVESVASVTGHGSLSCPQLLKLRIHTLSPPTPPFHLDRLHMPALITVELAKSEFEEDPYVLRLSDFLPLLSRSFSCIRQLSLSTLNTGRDELLRCFHNLVSLQDLILCGSSELLLGKVLPSLREASRQSATNQLASLLTISIIIDGVLVGANGKVVDQLASLISSWMVVTARREALRDVSLRMIVHWQPCAEEFYLGDLEDFTTSLRPWVRDVEGGTGFKLTVGTLRYEDRQKAFTDWVTFQKEVDTLL